MLGGVVWAEVPWGPPSADVQFVARARHLSFSRTASESILMRMRLRSLCVSLRSLPDCSAVAPGMESEEIAYRRGAGGWTHASDVGAPRLPALGSVSACETHNRRREEGVRLGMP